MYTFLYALKVKTYNTPVTTGNHLKITHEENPDKLKWKDLGVDYVIDSSGKFTEKEKAMVNIISNIRIMYIGYTL